MHPGRFRGARAEEKARKGQSTLPTVLAVVVLLVSILLVLVPRPSAERATAGTALSLTTEEAQRLRRATTALYRRGRGIRDAEGAVDCIGQIEKRLRPAVESLCAGTGSRETDACVASKHLHVTIRLYLADALNIVMRIKTHSNTLPLFGTLDTQEFRRIWFGIVRPLSVTTRARL